jgi:thiol-disulfide isomerase/thioredoxin
MIMRSPLTLLVSSLAIVAACVFPAADAVRAHDHAAPGMVPRGGDAGPSAARDMLGRPAPAWGFTRWVRGGPYSVAELRGRVVLVRWWTDGCRYCQATLPALERLRREHPRDLLVIGVYHPKPPRPVSDRHVVQVADRIGFGGPIALDQDWEVLGRYWLDGHPERDWTSVSFLIDRAGRIRWVHGGGEYHPSEDPGHAACDAAFGRLEKEIAAALAEPRPKT